MGLAEVLTIILAIAKLWGKVNIGWLVVFLPMIIVYSIIILGACIVFFIGIFKK